MTDHRATPEQWANMADAASDGFDDGYGACIFELRARVEALEKRCEVQLMQLSDLQERHHRLTLRVGHLEHELVRDDGDAPQQHCLEAMEPPETNSQSASNYPAKPDSSLVERVADAIGAADGDGTEAEARAAIRKVSKWLRERAGGTRASWLLDNEVEQ
jgi:hypothetical protein